MRCRKAILGLGVLELLSTAAAQSSHAVLQQGDTILGIGAMTLLDTVNVNDAKMWTAVIDTNFSDVNQDFAVMRSGSVTVREGMFFAFPEGSWLDEVESISINRQGALGMDVKCRVPGHVPASLDGVAYNTHFLVV